MVLNFFCSVVEILGERVRFGGEGGCFDFLYSGSLYIYRFQTL
jgi:hypothetical protein